MGTLRMSDYTPPDMGVSNLILVASEQLLSIEGAVEIQMDFTFSRGKAPLEGELSPKVTERLLQICGDLSVSASPSHLPWEGRPWGTHSKASPMRGSCRRRRLMRWGQLRRRRSVHLIRHGSAVPPSPRRGRHGAAPAQKSALPGREGRWGWELTRYRGSCTCCGG